MRAAFDRRPLLKSRILWFRDKLRRIDYRESRRLALANGRTSSGDAPWNAPQRTRARALAMLITRSSGQIQPVKAANFCCRLGGSRQSREPEKTHFSSAGDTGLPCRYRAISRAIHSRWLRRSSAVDAGGGNSRSTRRKIRSHSQPYSTSRRTRCGRSSFDLGFGCWGWRETARTRNRGTSERVAKGRWSMMASEGWLTTAIIMLQQADMMGRTHRLNLAAKVFTAREKPVSTNCKANRAFHRDRFLRFPRSI